MHIDYVHDNFQSVIPKFPKSQFDTLECTLEELAVLKWLILGLHIKQEARCSYVSRKELAVLKLIYKNPSIKQKNLWQRQENLLAP